jgi:hypothetical protein
MRTMSEANGSSALPHIKLKDAEDGVAVLEVEVGSKERALLEEAMQLTGVRDPGELLRVALRELVERQRFLSWVAAHDRKERSGTA